MRTIVRLYDRGLDILAAVAAAIILVVMIGVAADVSARYLIGRPIVWMFEITEYALLYIPCLGMGWLARERGHVAIESLVQLLPPRIHQLLFTATSAASAIVCAIVAYWGVIVVVNRFQRGTVIDQMIRTPEYLVLWVIPFGFALAAIEFARLIARGRRPAAEI